MTEKLRSGQAMPHLTLPTTDSGEIEIGGAGRWQMVVVYRGKHCPICTRYLTTLNELSPAFREAGVELVAISTDPAEKARPQAEELELSYPVGYALSIDQARELGLYISEPRSSQETDRPFAEPGTFVVNPDGALQIIDISNAPFSRPDPAGLLNGIKVIREKDYPIRGTA
jgi:peroxiredoxin